MIRLDNSLSYLLLTLVMLVTSVNVFGQTTFGDNFTTQAYNTNDGTGNWSTDWIEINDLSLIHI